MTTFTKHKKLIAGSLLLLGLFKLEFPAYSQKFDPALNVSFQTFVTPSMSLEIEGGTNSRGKKTFVSGQSINFGNVLFSSPELISNGDAFLDKQSRLTLEATLNLKVIFGGISGASLELSRLQMGSNTYSELLYSTALGREDRTDQIPYFPVSVSLGSVKVAGQALSIRVLGVIAPTQSGMLTDSIRLQLTPF